MVNTLTSGERLEQFDQDIEQLMQDFVHAVEIVQGAPEVDSSFDQRWSAIAQRLREVRTHVEPQDYDKQQLTQMFAAMMDIRDCLDGEPDLEIYDQLLIRLERIRHVVRDALDEHVLGIIGDVGLVVHELNERLPGVSQAEIAELVGVHPRTLTRWKGKPNPPSRRLRTVARLVAILRHNWTPDGVVSWFKRPRRDLDGRAPVAIIEDANFDEDALLMMARAGRSQYAS